MYSSVHGECNAGASVVLCAVQMVRASDRVPVLPEIEGCFIYHLNFSA